MTVRRLRAKQRGPRCNHCERRAVYRGCDFTRFACTAHHPELFAEDRAQAIRDSHESEADYAIRY